MISENCTMEEKIDLVAESNRIIESASIYNKTPMHYCKGCTHKSVHHQIVSVIDELKISEQVTGIAPVGCSSYIMKYFDVDMLAGPHGRAPAMASAIKALTDRIVFTYQGDGDIAAIGTSEIFHAAVRAENITVIYVNNATFGMTTGQSSPTSLLGQITRTDKTGRDEGYPFDLTKALATMPGVRFAQRTSCNTKENMKMTREAIKKAFTNQIKYNEGLNIVEVMAICPPALKKDVVASNQWMNDDLLSVYETGVLHQYDIEVLADESSGVELVDGEPNEV